MADSTGISAVRGRALSDWEHVQQSIRKILMTPIGSRVMRREFGSDLPDLVDQKMTSRNILALYSAAATAIARWEPRFRIRAGRVNQAGFLTTENGRVVRAGDNGKISLDIYGTYFPRGHLGDYSVSETRTARIVFEV
jgi:uncharacterized protein